MAVKMEKFEDYRKLTIPVYKVPKSVQQTIPISRISQEGIFEIENKPDGQDRIFDKAYLFWDTNYRTKDEDAREEFIKLYCKFLNTINVSFKILTMNNNRNMDSLKNDIYLRYKTNDPKQYKELVDSFNSIMKKRVEEGCSGIEQVKIFVITCERQDFDHAKAFFRTVEANIKNYFKKLGSGLVPLDASERLRFLHCFYRLGKEENFTFDWESACRLRDWRNDICNLAIKEYKDYLEFEDRFVEVLFAKSFPNSLSDGFYTELTSVPFHTITTIDVSPIPKEVTQKKLMDMYLKNGRSIEKQQEQRNKAQAYSSDISYDKRKEKEEIEEYLDIVRLNDENMYYVGLYVVVTAKTEEELASNVMNIQSIGKGHSLTFEPHIWNQLQAMNTSLPVGCRQVDTMRALFTQPLAALIPFNAQELCVPGGVYYGNNAISKNILVGDRKKLINGNGFILGISGGGKSVEAKMEMIQVCVNTSDDIIIIDPQNEYMKVVAELRGQYIDISSNTQNYINPLDTSTFNINESSQEKFQADKSQLILGICEQILGHCITASQKSIVDRCIRLVYQDFFGSHSKSPTMKEFYQIVAEQPEEDAQELRLSLELFVEGSLNIFSHATNVNVKNRLTAYGIRDLGKELAPVGMLVMLESIRSRIAQNAAKGIATWLYVDEFHNLVGESQSFSACFLEKIWKEVRKSGGLCTGITQNIVDLLASKTVETMLYNSEFVSLLRQSELELDVLSKVWKLSENELEFVRNSEKGCGLMKFGDKIIPKDNIIPKNNLLYDLVNTNFHEIQEMKKAKKSKPKDILRAVKELPGESQGLLEQEELSTD